MKRVFDFILSSLGLLVLSPVFLIISIWIVVDDGFPVFYWQIRVGQGGKDFRLFKFRTMRKDADKQGLLTIGGRDQRITPSGQILRKYKIDELPQLINVLFGNMSLVGPRPEVRKYVEQYSDEQLQVLNVKPGITDYASMEFVDESDLLAASDDPETVYVQQIMPAKLRLNLKYIREAGLLTDLKIIIQTILRILGRRAPSAKH